MQFALDLPQNRTDLALAEAQALMKSPRVTTRGIWTFLESEYAHPEKRLALAKDVYEILSECTLHNLRFKLLGKDVTDRIKGTWKFSSQGFPPDAARVLACELGSRIPNHADMKHPDTELVVLSYSGQAWIAIRRNLPLENYDERRPHLRIAPHPTGMHPRIARALINLTGVPDGGTIIDPMCGSGGFLIEAGRLGLAYLGSDFSDAMLRRAVLNLEAEGLPYGSLDVADATLNTDPIDYLVTDLPYGRGSILSDGRNELYVKFAAMLNKCLVHRGVIVAPQDARFGDTLGAQGGLRVTARFEIFVNRNLTREIWVVEKRST